MKQKNDFTSFDPKATFDRRVRNTLTNKFRVFSLKKKENFCQNAKEK